jgi:hypothetical protein
MASSGKKGMRLNDTAGMSKPTNLFKNVHILMSQSLDTDKIRVLIHTCYTLWLNDYYNYPALAKFLVM